MSAPNGRYDIIRYGNDVPQHGSMQRSIHPPTVSVMAPPGGPDRHRGGYIPTSTTSHVENVTDRRSNPFDMRPPCDEFVPGYGDANADVHVIGESPARHGGTTTGVPFTSSAAGRRLQSVLEDAGLIGTTGDRPAVSNLYLSYLDPCVDDGVPRSFSAVEPYFDAEVRAITAHVLVPVGDRVSRHVLEHFTTFPMAEYSMATVHATEISGGGWLVVPIEDPTDWTDADETAALHALEAVLARDYRRESDLGRFLTDPDPYFVR